MHPLRQTLAVCSFILAALGPTHARAQDKTPPRYLPACHNEELVRETVLSEILQHMEGLLPSPPGEQIMKDHKFGDLPYMTPDWGKFQHTQIIRKSLPRAPGAQLVMQEYRVTLHYMWNWKTKEFSQLKFKSTIDSGCVGKPDRPGPSTPPLRRGSSFEMPTLPDLTPSRRGDVQVSVPVPQGHPTVRAGMTCASCHSGSGPQASLGSQSLKGVESPLRQRYIVMLPAPAQRHAADRRSAHTRLGAA